MIRNFVDVTRPRTRRLEMTGRAVALSLACSASAVLSACASGADGPGTDSAGSSNEALRVMGCQSAAQGCLSGAQPPSQSACDAQLRSCLWATLPDAGFAPAAWAFDGGAAPLPGSGLAPPSLPDGGFSPPSLPDAGIAPPSPPNAGFPGPTTADAGSTPLWFPDGGLLPLPFPDAGPPGKSLPGNGGGGSPLGCADALHNCLGSATSPMQCADQALACFTEPTQAPCDAAFCLRL